MLSPHLSRQPQSLRKGLSVLLFLFSVSLAIVAGTALPATATTPQLVCSSTRLKFGWVAVGTSESQLVVLTNTGSTPVALAGVAVVGAEFNTLGTGLPKSLAAGQTATVKVTFAPTAAGWVAGRLIFSSNATNPNLILPIRGTGVKKEPVSAAPASLSFGQVPVGTTAKLTANLKNNCLCAQTLSALQVVDGVFAVTTPQLPITLARGQTIAMTVTFTPTAPGPNGGSVMIDGPYVNVPLSGTGTATTAGGVLSVTPGSVNFGSVELGTTDTQTSSLTATGGPVTVTSAASSNGQFAISGVSLPVTVPAGQSISFGVVFAPKNAGAASASLSFASSSGTTKTVEALAGTATMPYITLSWSPSTSQVAGYNIYRSASSSGPFSRLNSTLDTSTSFVDNSVGVGATYYYATTAVNSNGQESSYSNLAQVNIP